jgi:hypothetical protein
MACDAQTIIDDSTCVECFIPRGLQPAALLVILCAIRDGDTSMSCDPQAIIDEANCLQCLIPDGMMFPALISVACAIAAAGGGGEIGIVTPQGAVTATAGTTYYDSVADTFWVNLNGATLWKQLI